MLKLDKRLISEIQEKGIEKIKVFFYDAGCSGHKIDIIFDDFEIGDLILLERPHPGIPSPLGEKEATKTPLSSKGEGQGVRESGLGGSYEIYVEKKDAEKLEDCTITRVQKAYHTGEIRTRYIYTSEKVLDRCGCGTSFGFEKKKPTIDLSKLKDLKTRFN